MFLEVDADDTQIKMTLGNVLCQVFVNIFIGFICFATGLIFFILPRYMIWPRIQDVDIAYFGLLYLWTVASVEVTNDETFGSLSFCIFRPGFKMY